MQPSPNITKIENPLPKEEGLLDRAIYIQASSHLSERFCVLQELAPTAKRS
jgi:hypothetical protein